MNLLKIVPVCVSNYDANVSKERMSFIENGVPIESATVKSLHSLVCVTEP